MNVVLPVVIFSGTFEAPASAQGYVELMGSKWSKVHIAVYVASGTNDVQRQQVLFALRFIDRFEMGDGTPWLLYLIDKAEEAEIGVLFFIGQGVSFGGRVTKML